MDIDCTRIMYLGVHVIEIGKVNKLIVTRETKSGYYLTAPDSFDEIFMPPALGPINLTVNQEIDAFVYLDTKGSLIATDQVPHAVVGEYALLRVVETQEFGAFFDWGIDKDLLVPGNQQKFKVKKFEDHIVRVCLEEETDRIYGTTKLGKYIEASDFDIGIGDDVKIVPVQKTDLGYKSIINKKFIGMIYASEVFTDIQFGKVYDGVVKKIRNDGLVDAALQVQGVQNLIDSKDKILNILNELGGETPVYDKSSPEAIKSTFSMSKQTFKKAVGMLYKEKKITISKEGIKLV